MKLHRNMRQKLVLGYVVCVGGLATATFNVFGQSWEGATPAPLASVNESGTSWRCLASSADGLTLIGVIGVSPPEGYVVEVPGGNGPGNDSNGPVQPPQPPLPTLSVSTNAGATWMTNAPPNNWQAVASSANGKTLIAAATVALFSFSPEVVQGDELIYRSDDSGATWWLEGTPNNTWSCVASSADGTRLFAAANRLQITGSALSISGDGLIYARTDWGDAWTATTAPSADWVSLTASADGTKLAAASAGYWDSSTSNYVDGSIYISTNAGSNWILSSAPSNNWSAIASSADGTTLVAAASGRFGSIYISTDGGVSWAQTSAPSNDWTSVACSATGTRLLAGSITWNRHWLAGGRVWESDDGGATWATTGAPSAPWTAVACSADGYRAAVGSQAFFGQTDGWLCTLPYTGPWRLAEAPPNVSIVASSADGSLFAAAGDQQVYFSTNSGVTWKPSGAPSNHWSALAVAADGSRIVALDGGHYDTNAAIWMAGGIYLSLDSGATWTQTGAPSAGWAAVTCSPDGATLFAADAGQEDNTGWRIGKGGIYRSSDSGATWQLTSAPIREWTSIAASADSTRLVAGSSYEAEVWLSTNSGTTWVQAGLPTNTSWLAVAISADGSMLVADSGQTIYASSDAGVSWHQALDVPWDAAIFWTDLPWNYALASSADCSKLFAVIGDAVYASKDFGATWDLSDMPAGYGYGWQAVASSGDGNAVVVVGGTNYFRSATQRIAILRPPPPPPPSPPSPELSIRSSAAGATLSWLVPSTAFILQQSFDLTSGRWLDVTNQPTLNFTNLHNEVRLPHILGNAFYRLKPQ